MVIRLPVRRGLMAACLLAAAFASQAAVILTGPHTTVAPSTLVDPLGSLSGGLAPSQFLVPVQFTGAAALEQWTFSLRYDGFVASPIDAGGLYQSIYQAAAPGGESQITSSGLLLAGRLEDVSGFFEAPRDGDGILAYVLFGYVAGQEGRDPGVGVVGQPANPIPEPASGVLAAVALAGLAVLRRKPPILRSGRTPESTQVVWGRLLAAVAIAGAGITGSAHAQTVVPGPYYATPSWDQKLPAASRFLVLSNWNSEAVLDRETGLVWQREPSTERAASTVANTNCMIAKTGGRFGWRLPTVDELGSLLAPPGGPDTAPGTALPLGHPFKGVESSYFSSATYAGPPSEIEVFAQSFDSTGQLATATSTVALRFWCVRGGGRAKDLPLGR